MRERMMLLEERLRKFESNDQDDLAAALAAVGAG